jgi:hypothetical protein
MNNRNNAWIVVSGVYTWVRLKAVNEMKRVSQLSRLACAVPAVHFTCSRGTFCKSQCNQRQEQVGEDFSGNQPDQLSGFIGLHWTASSEPQSRASTPSSLQAATPSADFNYKSPGHRNQPPTSNIKELHLKRRIFTERANKSAYHLQWTLIVRGYRPHNIFIPVLFIDNFN